MNLNHRKFLCCPKVSVSDQLKKRAHHHSKYFSGSAGKHADSEPRRIFSVFSPSGLGDGAQLMLDVDSWDVLISPSVLCSDGR